MPAVGEFDSLELGTRYMHAVGEFYSFELGYMHAVGEFDIPIHSRRVKVRCTVKISCIPPIEQQYMLPSKFQRCSSADHQNGERVYYILRFVRSTFDFHQKQSSGSFSVVLDDSENVQTFSPDLILPLQSAREFYVEYLCGFEARGHENMTDVLVLTSRFQEM